MLALASPISSRFTEDSSYRPAKDIDAFNKLLPPPIEFVEGSSSGALSVGEGKYQPINEGPRVAAVVDSQESKKVQQPIPTKGSKSVPEHHKIIYTGPVETSWPNVSKPVGCGLGNTGNTCFLNSALQCLLHTPPLLHILLKHQESCYSPKPNNGSCMTCALRQVMQDVFTKPHSTIPYPIITKLHVIAKHLRRGRQEDSHEFLRCFIDAMQRSALAGSPPKVDPKLAERTWVYKVFGGLLRSRVSCLSCGHNSDTFDRMLDISVDIAGVASLRDALRKFVAVDHLRGADKYKCEKCKKPVNADKQFTIHEAPAVLTIHLKRFSPMGRKIAIPIRYDERLSLEPCMSEGSYGPTYSLYGVISHAGNGPNSGHYYAHVKGANGKWHEMNDDFVAPQNSSPTSLRNAYILFYILEKGQSLEAALASRSVTPARPTPPTSKIASMKKRKVPDSETEDERPTSAKAPKFIGPLLPPSQIASPKTPAKEVGKVDPQAQTLKKKIAAAQSQSGKGALQSLAAYGDDDDDDDLGEAVSQREDDSAASPTTKATSSATPIVATLEPAQSNSSNSSGISPQSFYGASTPKSNGKKRKTPDAEQDNLSYKEWARTPITPASSHKARRHSTPRFSAANPFAKLTGSNNLHTARDSPLSSSPNRRRPGHGPKKRFMI